MSTAPSAFPAPRIPSPAAAPTLRWGIAGPGAIASVFATSLTLHTTQILQAVGSRSAERAEAFAQRFSMPSAHSSYEDLFADPEVDVIYLCTPNNSHHHLALKALAAGKHLVVEKPFTLSPAETSEVLDAARNAGLFAMEAMWPRFLPAMDIVRRFLAEGHLGELHGLQADLGEHFTPDASHRLFDPGLGGGALLDLGVYLVAFAHFAGGTPVTVRADGRLAFTGVDAQAALLLETADGFQSQLFTTLSARTPTRAMITGSKGTLSLGAPFYMPSSLQFTPVDGSAPIMLDLAPSTPSDSLCFEAAEASRCIAAGLSESPLMPHEHTLRISGILAEAAGQIASSAAKPIP